MLKLLLDEHISPEVAEGLGQRKRSLVVHGMAERESCRFLGEDDSTCSLEAARLGLTLITYDRRTISPLLKIWAESGRERGGVIFVGEKTILPSDIGGLVRALLGLWKAAGKWNWTDRLCLLAR